MKRTTKRTPIPKKIGTSEPASGRVLVVILGLLVAAAPLGAQLHTDPYQRPNDPANRHRGSAYGRNLEEQARRLGDPRPEIRLGAVKALGESRDPAAIRYLIEAVLDPDVRVAVRAVEYLGELRATEATHLLAERLFFSSTSDTLRHRILGALAEIGDSRAMRALIELAKHRGRDPKLRGAAIYAIGEIGDSTFRDEVVAILEGEDDPGLRRVTAEALAKIEGRRFEPTPLPTIPNPLLRPLDP